MVPKKIKASEGETKGISTLLKAYSDKKGLFKCILCGKEEERGVHTWFYNDGFKTCTCMNKHSHKNLEHKLYGRYCKMIHRCYSKNAHNYSYYGGKGIKVCDRWLESFGNFLEDMESSFEEGLELDRIDNDGDYTPENCKWTTHSKNMSNRREFKNKTGFPNVKKENNKYIGRVQRNKIVYQTKNHNTPEDAYNELQDIKKSL